jgi:CRISPR-associated protein Csm4
MIVFKFYPENRAKFRFGDSGGKLKEIVSSDQLFSALYNCAVLLYGSAGGENSLLYSLQKLIISSLFYGVRFENLSGDKSKEILFLPRPLAPISCRKQSADLLQHKRTKKIKYLSAQAFNRLQKKWQNAGKYFDFDLLDFKAIGGNFACTREEIESLSLEMDKLAGIKLFNFYAEPKVNVSRLNGGAEDFYYQEEMELTYLQADQYLIRPFLYFICREISDRRLKAVVRLMAEEGLGGKRSQGMGALGEVTEDEWSPEWFEGGGRYYVALSSIFPRADETDKLLYYELTERSGYIYSQQGRTIRKKRVRLLKEGSVFSDKIAGRVIDIRPQGFTEHQVLLNGNAFLIPIGEV